MAPIAPTGPGVPIYTAPGDISYDALLKDPLVLQALINDFPAGYFITDELFDSATAESGVALYNQLSSLDIFLDTDANFQPQNVNPGDEFPAVDISDTIGLVATTMKYGGFFALTDEQIRRSRRDELQQKLRRLKNSLVVLSNARAIAALLADASVVANSTTGTTGIWSTTSNNPLNDVVVANNAIDYGVGELGYRSEIAIVHPDAFAFLQGWLALNPGSLPREGRTDNPLFNKEISGLKGLDWIVTRRIPRATMIVAQRGCGTLVSEIPPFTEVVPERMRQRTVVISGRQEVPVVTAPYGVHVTTGIIA